MIEFKNREQNDVLKFHQEFELLINDSPTMPDKGIRRLRLKLIEEELEELHEAFMETEDIVEVADALADLLYVVYGAGVSCGVDLQEVWDEVQRSNMSKVGGVKNEHGKLIKPDTYSPADIKSIIEKQMLNRQ